MRLQNAEVGRVAWSIWNLESSHISSTWLFGIEFIRSVRYIVYCINLNLWTRLQRMPLRWESCVQRCGSTFLNGGFGSDLWVKYGLGSGSDIHEHFLILRITQKQFNFIFFKNTIIKTPSIHVCSRNLVHWIMNIWKNRPKGTKMRIHNTGCKIYRNWNCKLNIFHLT